jgi:ribosome-binding protein aMBF1 (putative translation factor)
LYDAISNEGIVKICDRCLHRENLPIIKRVEFDKEGEQIEKRPTVRERLTYMSGFKPRERENQEQISERQRQQDEEIKKVIIKKYQEELKNSNLKADISGDSGMIRNFHWAIMRARRAKHMSQKQLADMIYEPEVAIKMAEKGILPREKERLVKKIENALKVRLTQIPYDTYTQIPPEQKEEVEVVEEGLEETKEKKRKWTIGDLLRGKVKIKFSGEKKDPEESEDVEKSLEDELKEE